MADDLCPICHSNIEPSNPDWTKDPVLTIRGLAGEEYKGTIKLDIKYIKEIQDKRKQQEIDIGISEENRTQFTEITPGKTKWNKKYINELRESTEKILGIIETTTEEERIGLLREYFNYDEYWNYIGTYKYGQKIDDKEEWTSIDINNKPKIPKKTATQQNIVKIKAINIEDLRHPIIFPNLALLSGEQLTWFVSRGVDYRQFDGDYYSYIVNTKEKQLIDLNHYFDDSLQGIAQIKTADAKYFYAIHRTPYPSYVDVIEAYSWNLNESKRFYFSIDNYPRVRNILSDGEYLWIFSRKWVYTTYPYGNFKDCLYRININTKEQEFVDFLPEYIDYYIEDVISIDKKYLYIIYDAEISKKIIKLNKVNLEVEQSNDIPKVEEVCSRFEYAPGLFIESWISETWDFFHACSDDEYIYFKRWIWDDCGEIGLLVNEIARISKETLGINSFLSLSTREDLEDITVDKNFVYLLFCNKHLVSIYNLDNPIGSLEIYDKKTKQLVKTYNQDIGRFSFNKYQERLLTKTHPTYGSPRYLNFNLSIATKEQGRFANNLPKYLL